MTNRTGEHRVAAAVFRAPTGSTLSCKGWEQEAALRMLLNSADADVAERPAELSADSGSAQPLHAAIAALRDLENDQTLVIRPGEPAGAFRTHGESPRVVMASAGDGDTGESILSAAHWLNVGPQTGLPIVYESLAAAAKTHFSGTLSGRLISCCGLGEAGGPHPLAATLNGATFLGIDADADRIKRRVKTGYCEVMVNDLDEALRILKNSVRKREPASVGLIGNCAEVIPELASRGIVPDLLLDCTLGDALFGSYIPRGLLPAQAAELRRADAQAYRDRALESTEAQVKGTLELQRLGSRVYRIGSSRETRNANLQSQQHASKIPDFTAAFTAPLFTEGRSLLLWVALSGEPADISRADRLALEIFAPDAAAIRFLQLAARHVHFQGLPARVCLVDPALRARFGVALNEMVAQHALSAPLLIGCQNASRPPEAPPKPRTGEDIDSGFTEADFKELLAALSPQAGAASLVATPAGERRTGSRLNLATVADGTAEMKRRISQLLDNFQ